MPNLDLIEIGLYIAADNPEAADRFLDKLDEKIGFSCRFSLRRPSAR